MKFSPFIYAVAALILCFGCAKGPTSVSVSPSSLSLTEGESASLTANVLPEDAKYGSISWSSADTKVATVSGGMVTAVSAGTTTVTASTEGVSGSATVTVMAKIVPPQAVKVTGVSLDKESIGLTEGEETVLVATVTPDDATDKSCSWASSDDNVVSVSQNGRLKALEAGSAVVTVTTTDGGFTASCKVDVAPLVIPVAVESVVLEKKEVYIPVGGQETLAVSIYPEDATDKSLEWSSFDEKIATVDGDGTVTAVAAGQTTVLVLSADNPGAEDRCSVFAYVPAESLTLDIRSLNLAVGETFFLATTVTPSEAAASALTWISSDPGVVTVDERGWINAVAVGTARITVSTVDGLEAYCDIEVFACQPESITIIPLEDKPEGIYVGETLALSATVSPEGSVPCEFVWSSGDSSIATVDPDGLVTGVSQGWVYIYATSSEHNLRANFSVYVKEWVPVTTFYFYPIFPDQLEDFKVGETTLMQFFLRPWTASNREFSVWSSDESVLLAYRSEEGDRNNYVTVEAVGPGTAKLMGKTEDGGLTAEYEMTVIMPVSGVSLDKTVVTMTEGSTEEIKVTVEPENATDKRYYWDSGNPDVAWVETVGGKDYIRTGQPGKARLFCHSTYAMKYYAICEVTVVAKPVPVKSVKLTNTVNEVGVGHTYCFHAEVLPSDATDNKVTWTSSDPSVLYLDNPGQYVSDAYVNVHGVKPGKAVITVKSDSNPALYDKKEITVYETGSVTVPVTGITFDKTSWTMAPGESFNISVQVHPYGSNGATNPRYEIMSTNPSVATVDEHARVTALKEGQTVIRATTVDGGFTAECRVTVTSGSGGGSGDNPGGDNPAPTIHVTGVDITNVAFANDGKAYYDAGQRFDPVAVIFPADATKKIVTWSSSNKNVATVQSYGYLPDTGDPIGRVTCVAPGSTRITVKTVDGSYTDSFDLQVVVSAKSITLVDAGTGQAIGSSFRMKQGGIRTIKASLSPSNSTDKVVWNKQGAIDIVSTGDNTVTIKAAVKGTGKIIATVPRIGNMVKSADITVE